MKSNATLLGLLLLVFCSISAISCNKENYTAPGTNDVGTGGSLARFTIALNHLYVVDQRYLYTYSLSDPQKPLKLSTREIGFNIETIYTWKDKLFIGSQEAMYVYSIASPSEPSLLGNVRHIRACDPIVAQDTVAYVTLRTGAACGGSTNALYVYNLRDILNPAQLNVINLGNPHGLGLQEQTLFVCDGSYGLKVFDVSDPFYPIQTLKVSGETFYDCIPHNNLLICMVEGGMAIYDISNKKEITLLATIKG